MAAPKFPKAAPFKRPTYVHSPGLGTFPSPSIVSSGTRPTAPPTGITGTGYHPIFGTSGGTHATPRASSPATGGAFPGALTPAQILAQATSMVHGAYQPQVDYYNTLISQAQAANSAKITLLRGLLAQAATSLGGLPQTIQDIYQNAAQGQGQLAQGFSQDLQQTLQGEADKTNQLLASIGAPQGQMIPGSQAQNVGDVAYGLGGYLNAASLEGQGVRAAENAAQLPGQIWQQGLGLISQYQADESQTEAQYQAQLAQIAASKPADIQKAVADINQQQADLLKQAQGDAYRQQQIRLQTQKVLQDVADSRTKATGTIWVVTPNGQVKQATGRNGKPIPTIAGMKATQGTRPLGQQMKVLPDGTVTVFDPNTGSTRIIGHAPKPVDPKAPTIHTFPNGDAIQWNPRTQKWDPIGNFAKPPTPRGPYTLHTAGGDYLVTPTAQGGYKTRKISGPKLNIVKDTKSGTISGIDPNTGQAVWTNVDSLTPDTPSLHFYKSDDGSEHVMYYDPKTNAPVDTVIAGPAAPQPKIVVDKAAGTISAIDPTDGHTVWTNIDTLTPSTTANKPPETFSSNGQRYAWVQNKYGNWVAQPIGPPPPKKPRFTPLQIAHFRADAADTARSLFWGSRLKDGTPDPNKPPVHYQDAMNFLLQHGIPLDIAQRALNQYWKRPGYDADIANRQNGKVVWFHSASGRPVHPFQERQASPKGDAAAAATVDPSKYVYVRKGANRAGVNINSGVIDFVGRLGAAVGQRLQISTGSNHNQFVAGSGNQSQHWTGDAADIPATGKRLLRLGRQALIMAGMDPSEAMTKTGGAFTVNGYNILFNTMTGGNHYNHLHVGLTSAAEQSEIAKAGGPATEPTTSPTRTTASAGSSTQDASIATTPEGARKVAMRLATSDYGWTGNELAALDQLWTRESGFDYQIHNKAGSGAVGIPQAMPTAHTLPPDYMTNPVTQILWGLAYIKSTYGTPSNAWRFWQATVNKNAAIAPPKYQAKAREWISKGYTGY